MSFSKAYALLLDLEGGYHEVALTGGGVTFAGISKGAWTWYSAAKGIAAHWPPTPTEVQLYYTDEFWLGRFSGALPEPADAVWLQCAVDLPLVAGNVVLQNSLFVKPDGDITGTATQAAFRRIQGADLAMRLLVAQRMVYTVRDDADKDKSLDRTVTVLAALNGGQV